eukprot:TRINITY_DN20308_c0_g1_i1.p2 TRINITY_DN20308_c0_g1~~TRINITY_DN20308_c0_g1_i1.p2  ORF type:complete len:100 (-),score=30.60 TRINITY_DN20308_c0_g1_i1:168-467(-)
MQTDRYENTLGSLKRDTKAMLCNEWSAEMAYVFLFFFFSSRRRHTRCREVSWARRCVQETVMQQSKYTFFDLLKLYFVTLPRLKVLQSLANLKIEQIVQ